MPVGWVERVIQVVTPVPGRRWSDVFLKRRGGGIVGLSGREVWCWASEVQSNAMDQFGKALFK